MHVTHATPAVDLVDGRTITVPLAWYPRLLGACMEQRAHKEITTVAGATKQPLYPTVVGYFHAAW